MGRMSKHSQRLRRLGSAAAAAALVVAASAGPATASPHATPGESASTQRAGGHRFVKVPAQEETVPPRGKETAADDPGIWLAEVATDSLIFGSLKVGGIDAYNLSGEIVQHINPPGPPGEGLKGSDFNNLDVIQGAAAAGFPGDLVVVSDRGRDRLRIYVVDPRGAATPGGKVLTDITDPAAPRLFSKSEAEVEDQLNAYGLALHMTAAGGVQAIVTRRNTTDVGMFDLQPTEGGLATYVRRDKITMPDHFKLPNGDQWYPCTEEDEPPKLEGMVIDRRTHVLYAAQEEVGIWRVPLDDTAFGTRQLIERGTKYGVQEEWDPDTEECAPVGDDPGYGGKHLVYQVEGLAIAYLDDGTGTLVVSSQGNSTIAFFRLASGEAWEWYRQIRISQSAATDGASQTDGVAVVTEPVGPTYPHGLLVVQDGHNRSIGGGTDRHIPRTDFKYVRWNDAKG